MQFANVIQVLALLIMDSFLLFHACLCNTVMYN